MSKFNAYITAEGHRRLVDELKHLWKVERPEVTRKVQEAAAQGDRSENAEYIYGKRQLRAIDRRVRFLAKRLDELQIVSRLPADQSRVFFGAWVSVEDDRGSADYRLVGADEFDPKRQFISIASPLARALLGKSVDDEVVVQTPEGERQYVITGIRYEPASPV